MADRFYPSYDVATGVGGIGLSDVGEGLWVAEHRQGLLQLGEVLGAEQDGDLAAVAGDGHPFVVLLNPVDCSDRWSRTALNGSVVTATIVAHPMPYLRGIPVETNRRAL